MTRGTPPGETVQCVCCASSLSLALEDGLAECVCGVTTSRPRDGDEAPPPAQGDIPEVWQRPRHLGVGFVVVLAIFLVCVVGVVAPPVMTYAFPTRAGALLAVPTVILSGLVGRLVGYVVLSDVAPMVVELHDDVLVVRVWTMGRRRVPLRRAISWEAGAIARAALRPGQHGSRVVVIHTTDRVAVWLPEACPAQDARRLASLINAWAERKRPGRV